MTTDGYRIKEWPSEERPRERLEALGPRALSPRELLAILIETGMPARGGRPGRSAVELAGDLLRHFAAGEGEPSLRRLMTAPIAELCRVPGIGPAKATKILAALDLGRRAAEEARPERDRVRSPRDVYERMSPALRDLPHEEFHVLLLNTQNQILRDLQVTRGTLDASLVHPREVFRAAITEAAAAVILVHNHPSGDPSPSAEDRGVTRQLRDAGDTLGIEVLDHVIVGEGRYVSFVEAGLWNA
ncbi:MAG: DNA repair protein RadC [Gemmatimonadota bacterium]|nr:DNA repair protein RadC [Gemmatimonadota bacterium]